MYNPSSDSHEVMPTAALSLRKPSFEIATGHSAKRYSKRFENELVALAEGAKKLVVGESDFAVVDVGSRDIKFVKFTGGKVTQIDWSSGCASSTGATIEMLARFYELDFDTIETSKKYINVTCGTFALEKIMDMVASGHPASLAVSQFVHGLVRNILNFLSHPEKLYLSGGFCENKLFVSYLSNYLEAVPLGRFVLIEGLCSILASDGGEKNAMENQS